MHEHRPVPYRKVRFPSFVKTVVPGDVPATGLEFAIKGGKRGVVIAAGDFDGYNLSETSTASGATVTPLAHGSKFPNLSPIVISGSFPVGTLKLIYFEACEEPWGMQEAEEMADAYVGRFPSGASGAGSIVPKYGSHVAVRSWGGVAGLATLQILDPASQLVLAGATRACVVSVDVDPDNGGKVWLDTVTPVVAPGFAVLGPAGSGDYNVPAGGKLFILGSLAAQAVAVRVRS